MIYTGTYFNTSPEVSPPSFIYGLNESTLDIEQTIELTDQIAVADLKIDRSTNMLYAITRAWSAWHTEVVSKLYKIDLSTHTISTSIATGTYPINRGLAIDTTNGVGYFMNYANPCIISKFSLNDLSIIATKTTAVNTSSGGMLGINLSTQSLFFARNNATLYKLDLSDFTTITSVGLAQTPACLESKDGFIYVGTTGGIPPRVYKIDAATLAISGYLEVGEFYNWTMSIDSTNDKLYVASSYGSGKLITIDLSSFTTTSTTSFDDYGIADFTYPFLSCSMTPINNYLYWGIGSASDITKSYIVKLDLNKNMIDYEFLPILCSAATIDWVTASLPISSIYHKWHEPVVL